MGSRERLALFNMLGDLTDSYVLDAFAGSGALGIEALSRGASKVVFVEKTPSVAKVIRQNLAELGLSEAGEVLVGDAGGVLRGGAKASLHGGADRSSQRGAAWLDNTETYDVIMADPPYDAFDIKKVLPLSNKLRRGGVLVLSHPGETPEIEGLTLEKTRKYAAAHLSFYRAE